MVSISCAVRRVKDDPGAVLSRDQVAAACGKVEHRFRCRKLDPFLTIIAMVVQVMHGNTPIAHLVRLMHGAFNESAFCQARARLPLEVLLALLAEMTRRVRGMLRDPDTPGRWLGHRTLLIDGTGFSMPDTPALRKHFGLGPNQKPECGFPVGHLVALFDAATGFVVDIAAAARCVGDMMLAAQVRSWLRPGDLLIGDRAFCSFAHLSVLRSLGAHGLFRLHQSRLDHRPVRRKRRRRKASGNIKDEPILVRRVSCDDRIVEWLKPCRPAPWQTPKQYRSLPEAMLVRVLRFHVMQTGWRTRTIFVATTLLDPVRYPSEALAQLYMKRWGIELSFRHLKQTMDMDVLRCKSVAGVRKELAAFALVYNLVRLVMLDAAMRQGVEPDRISFKDALRWLQTTEPDEPLPRLKVNPIRAGRFEPRAIKRRPSRAYPFLFHSRHAVKRYLRRGWSRLI